MDKCDHCRATTQDGKLCKRLAACKIGCYYFCWQHTKQYGGIYIPNKLCSENLQECSKYNDIFPCIKKETVFMTEKEYKAFKKSKKKIKKTRPYKRKERLQHLEQLGLL